VAGEVKSNQEISMKKYAVFTMILLAATVAFAGNTFLASVGLSGQRNEKGNITGQVGSHFEAKISYSIGIFHIPNNAKSGTHYELVQSAIINPEYELFSSSGNLPPGLTFDSTTGALEGVPTQPGVWNFRPAVRERTGNEKGYVGKTGYWIGTQTTEYQGHTYVESKDYITIEIAR
jgi:hypothetical protein